MDLLAGQSFVATVVRLLEKGRDLGSAEARELRGAPGSLHRARVGAVEAESPKPGPEQARLRLALARQREVGGPCVAAGQTPLGLAVTSEVELEAQAGLPIISGRPERRERPALSSTAPARTRWPGRHT